ncbi:MAG: hypothetical protein QM813_20535 [Verrucomicrobiota bacterium]
MAANAPAVTAESPFRGVAKEVPDAEVFLALERNGTKAEGMIKDYGWT